MLGFLRVWDFGAQVQALGSRVLNSGLRDIADDLGLAT